MKVLQRLDFLLDAEMMSDAIGRVTTDSARELGHIPARVIKSLGTTGFKYVYVAAK